MQSAGTLHFSDVSLALIWDKNCGVLSCSTHLSMEMCVGMDVSGDPATHHRHTFPEKPGEKKKIKKRPFPSTCVLANHLSGHLSPSGVVEGTPPCPSRSPGLVLGTKAIWMPME